MGRKQFAKKETAAREKRALIRSIIKLRLQGALDRIGRWVIDWSL
jgi:hypothetical protein